MNGRDCQYFFGYFSSLLMLKKVEIDGFLAANRWRLEPYFALRSLNWFILLAYFSVSIPPPLLLLHSLKPFKQNANLNRQIAGHSIKL